MHCELIVLLVALSHIAHGVFLYSSSIGPFDCVVKDGEVYVAGLPYQKLSAAEQLEATKYTKRVQRCRLDLHTLDWTCTKPPTFCGAKRMRMYILPGCTILGKKLYRNEKFVRVLVGKDQRELRRYLKAMRKYEAQMESASGYWGYEFGFLDFDRVPAPQPPSFCGNV